VGRSRATDEIEADRMGFPAPAEARRLEGEEGTVGRTRRRGSALVGIAALTGGLFGTAGVVTFASLAGADTGDPVSITLGPDSTPDPMPVLFQGSVSDDESAPSPLQHVELDVIRDVSGGDPQVVDSVTTDSGGSFSLTSNLSANNSYALRQKVPPGWSQAPYASGGGTSLTLPAGSSIVENGPPGNGPTGVGQVEFPGATSVTNNGSITVTGAAAGYTAASGLPVTVSNNGTIAADHPIAFGETTGSIGVGLAPVQLTDTLTNPAPIVTGNSLSTHSGQSAALDPASFTVARYWATSGPAPTASDFTATITWGDGTTSSGVVAGPDADGQFSVSAPHEYAAPGTYTGAVTVLDGATGDQTAGDFTSSVTTPVQPPTISKSFGTASIPLGGLTSLTFTVTNNGSGIVSGLGFTDALPTGLVVATPTNGLGGSCHGTVTALPGSSTVDWAGNGSTLQPGGSCTVSVNVMATSSGVKENSVAVTSDQGIGNTASASVTVRSCSSGQKAYLFTGTTRTAPPATIIGVFCVGKTGQATYQQGTVSGSGGVNVNGSSNNFIALGSNMNLGGGTSGPSSQFTEVQPLKATGTYTLTTTS
jgi:Domain of unknown function DUF11